MNQSGEKPDLSRLTIKGEKTAPVQALPGRKVLIAGAAAALVLIILFSFSCDRESEEKNNPASGASLASVPGVAASSAGLNATGYVVAQRKAAVSSKATGRLRKLNVVEGDSVKQGDLIAELENDDLAALVSQQEAFVTAQQARLNAVEAELENAGLEKDRALSLRREKVISQSELDKALARYRKASADVESEKANLTLGRAQLEKSRVDLEYTRILAPFDGTVLTKNADVGEIVAPFGASADARAAVVTIADMSSLEVEADVSEANITRVSIGQPCEIVLDSFPGKTYHGTVVKIVPTVDRAKATVLTKIRFSDRDEHVLPEMSAKVAFKAGSLRAQPIGTQ